MWLKKYKPQVYQRARYFCEAGSFFVGFLTGTPVNGWCGSSYMLTSVTISDSVTSIGFGAFDGTAYQQDVTNWDNGVLYISNYLIATNPDEIPNNYIIKEGTKVVAKYAFSQLFEDFNFTSISIPSSMLLESLEYMFDSNKIPDTLSRIDIDSQEVPYGFASGCTNIARVNIYRCLLRAF